MTDQTVCDRCNKVPGGYAKVKWDVWGRFAPWPVTKDLCKDCFNKLFPEWKVKSVGLL